MIINRFKLVLVAALVALSFVSLESTADASRPDTTAVIAEFTRDRSSLTLVPRAGVSKDEYNPDAVADRLLPKSGTDEMSIMSYDVTLYGSSAIYSCPSSCGNVTNSFDTTWTMLGFDTEARVSYGEEHGFWGGSTPWNADTMRLSGTYTVWGTQSSISASLPVGFSVSYSGSTATATWSGAASNTFSIDHYYQPGPTFYANSGSFTRLIESSSTEAQFGSNIYSTTSSDDSYL